MCENGFAPRNPLGELALAGLGGGRSREGTGDGKEGVGSGRDKRKGSSLRSGGLVWLVTS